MSAGVAPQSITETEATQKTERLVSLDVFRGLTVAAMILVNNPGSWEHVYSPLEHAAWNGWTPTDLVFPFFLFIVGIAIPYSLGGKLERGAKKGKLIPGILRRSAILFGLGLFLASFPSFNNLATIRIPGVLARIAVCYLFAALVFLLTSPRMEAILAAILLAVYWIVMKLVPVPAAYINDVIDRGGNVEKEANIAAYVDNLLLHGHLWRQTRTWDPEGLLSTIPAIATVLLGILTGYWLKSNRSAVAKIYGLLGMGVVGIAAGEVMNIWFPINKNLWTSSYVVFTAGAALVFLALCYWLVDYRGHKRLATPFVVFGVNAIALYVLSGMVEILLGRIKTGGVLADGAPQSLQGYIYQHFFASWAGPMNGSLFFAIAFIGAMFLPMLLLYRKRIFIRV